MIYAITIPITALFAIMIFPFRVHLRAFFDPKKNRLFYLLVVFGFIKVGAGYLTFKDGKLYEKNYKGKFENIDFSKGAQLPMDIKIFKLLKYAHYRKMNTFIEVSTNDMIPQIMLKALFDSVMGVITSIIRTYNKKIVMHQYVISKKEGNKFQLSIDGIMRISIANIIYVILDNKFKKNKENKWKKTQTAETK